MEIGIAGLPGAGKTTVFNALAGAHAQVGGFRGGPSAPNRAVVHVPDPRFDRLVEMFIPKSVKPAEVQFVDVAGLAKGAGLDSEAAILGQLRTVDALLLVVSVFLPGATSENAAADLANIETEFVLADLGVVERRLEKLEREVRMARANDTERPIKERELDLLSQIKAALEREEPIRSQGLAREERWLLRGYALLTAKPALAILNTGDDVGAGQAMLAALAHSRTGGLGWLAIPGRLEMELAELDPAEAQEFMVAMGIERLSSGPVIQASQQLLDLIPFFTVGPDEVRAWPIERGSTALDAAGTIHTDLARGFIRAEVVAYADLIEAGGLQEARRRGKLRSEGKGYVVQDGDVINVLFNV